MFESDVQERSQSLRASSHSFSRTGLRLGPVRGSTLGTSQDISCSGPHLSVPVRLQRLTSSGIEQPSLPNVPKRARPLGVCHTLDLLIPTPFSQHPCSVEPGLG